jgi:hypothetical protein
LNAYAKAIAAVVLAGATLLFDQFGTSWGLPADWPQTVTAVLTPVAVWWFANKGA